MENKTIIHVSDLLKKFRTKSDRQNFCREIGVSLPSLPGYDVKYFLQFMKGTKKLLPLGVTSGFSFRYFNKEKKFTKEHLYSFFENDEMLKSYLPDGITVDALNRDYLFAVLAYAKKDTYLELYNDYKKMLANANYSKWESYGIEVDNAMAAKVEQYVSTGVQTKEKPFRLSKKGVRIEEIKDLNNNNQINMEEDDN